MYHLRVALLLCFVLVGCGKKNPPTEEGSKPTDAPAVTTENYPDDPELTTRRTIVDLSPYGIRGAINAPTSVRVTPTKDGIVLNAGTTFALAIDETPKTISTMKAEWKPKVKEWLTDEATLIVAALETPQGLSHALALESTLGQKKVLLYTPSDQPQTATQVQRAVEVAKSITQTEAIQQSIGRETAIKAKLQKNGCRYTPSVSQGELLITGELITNDDLADVKDIAGLHTVHIQHPANLTEQGYAHLTACRGVRTLILSGVNGDDAKAFANFSSLETLIIDKHDFNDTHLAFLANLKQLRSLAFTNTDSAKPSAITSVGLTHLKGLKLQSLDLSGLRVNEAMLENIAGLRSLVELNLSNARVGEAGTKSLQSLVNLKRLVLSNSPVGDLGLQYFNNMTQLQTLLLNKTAVRNYGLSSLVALTQLRHLSLADTAITDSSLDKLKGLKLDHLDLSRTNITDTGLKNLAPFADVRVLSLSGTRITDAGLSHLTPFTQLTSLNLANTDITGTGLTALKGCTQLNELHLDDTLVTSDALKELAPLTALQSLTLADSAITDAGLETLAAHKGLRRVELSECDVTKPAVEKYRALDPQRTVVWEEPEPVPEVKPVAPPMAVEALPAADPTTMLGKFGGKLMREGNDPEKPARITLSNRDVTDLEIAHLRGVKQLQSLSLNGCSKLTDACLPYIALLPDLEVLSLNGTAITGDGLVHLKGLSNLKELELTTPVTIAQVAPLAALRGLTHLRMKVSGPPDAVFKFFAGFKRLRDLDLSRLRLNNRRLANLNTMTNLERLEIQSNLLGDRGLAHLKELSKLQELYLRSDLVTDAGFKQLSDLPSLRVLELATPQLTDAGLTMLLKATELERLKLVGTRLTDRGLANLRNCGKLRELELRGADISDRGLANLENLNELELVDVSGTKVTDAGLKVFQGKNELRKLVLEDTAITGQGFALLNKLERLYRVYLARSQCNDAGVLAIAQVSTIELLDLEATPITEAALPALKNLPELGTLILNKNQALTDKATDALKMLPRLGELHVRDTAITSTGLSDLRKKEGLKVNGE